MVPGACLDIMAVVWVHVTAVANKLAQGHRVLVQAVEQLVTLAAAKQRVQD
jgi:hypothetical protein